MYNRNRRRAFELIGRTTPSDLHFFTGNIQKKDGNVHYLPNGFVYWSGDPEARMGDGWFLVKKFNQETNMPVGLAYRVLSNENGPIFENGHPRIVDDEGYVIGSDGPDNDRIRSGHTPEELGFPNLEDR